MLYFCLNASNRFDGIDGNLLPVLEVILDLSGSVSYFPRSISPIVLLNSLRCCAFFCVLPCLKRISKLRLNSYRRLSVLRIHIRDARGHHARLYRDRGLPLPGESCHLQVCPALLLNGLDFVCEQIKIVALPRARLGKTWHAETSVIPLYGLDRLLLRGVLLSKFIRYTRVLNCRNTCERGKFASLSVVFVRTSLNNNGRLAQLLHVRILEVRANCALNSHNVPNIVLFLNHGAWRLRVFLDSFCRAHLFVEQLSCGIAPDVFLNDDDLRYVLGPAML